MKFYSLKEHIEGPVAFQYYASKYLIYKTHLGLLFQVPLDDTGTGIFNRDDKGIYFMRWIRPALEALKTEESYNQK